MEYLIDCKLANVTTPQEYLLLIMDLFGHWDADVVMNRDGRAFRVTFAENTKPAILDISGTSNRKTSSNKDILYDGNVSSTIFSYVAKTYQWGDTWTGSYEVTLDRWLRERALGH